MIAATRWASNARLSRKPLYRLSASLNRFTVEASVHPHGAKGFCASVLVDQVHAPGSPAGNFPSLEAAVQRAKADFQKWTLEMLKRA